MLKKSYLLFIAILVSLSIQAQKEIQKTWIVNDMLKVHQLSEHLFIHESILRFKDFEVACNGVIFTEGPNAIMLDTPSDSSTTVALITFVRDTLNAKIGSVGVTHFHVDALGGLNACKAAGMYSFGHKKTVKYAKKNKMPFPENGVISLQMSFCSLENTIVMKHLGKAHTKDNVVFYIPSEKTLFGGCAVKTMNAGYGNLDDAVVKDWPKTMKSIREEFPEIETVIPGHGAHGGVELLDYTAKLMRNHESIR